MIDEESLQVGLRADEKAADVEREGAGQGQENKNEDKSDWGREVCPEFPHRDDANVTHDGPPCRLRQW